MNDDDRGDLFRSESTDLIHVWKADLTNLRSKLKPAAPGRLFSLLAAKDPVKRLASRDDPARLVGYRLAWQRQFENYTGTKESRAGTSNH